MPTTKQGPFKREGQYGKADCSLCTQKFIFGCWRHLIEKTLYHVAHRHCFMYLCTQYKEDPNHTPAT